MSNVFENRIKGYGTKPADQFTPNEFNYRKHPQRQRDAVQASLRELGWIGVVVENAVTGTLIDGHERVWQALKNNENVPYIEVELSEDEEKLALAIFDPIGAMAETDAAILEELLQSVNTGEASLQALLAELAEDAGLYPEPEPVTDAGAQVDKAGELQAKWQTALGQLWQLGEHRLICGDCTDAEVVARLMGGEKAVLCHADPPYGMGKENEGIANDNLYRQKLDAFQMLWWRACRPLLEDNASAYIWGNPQDLWRLWYCGGLKDGERLTFRNEIVWDKGGGGFGVGTESQRSYFPEEHCLFFMLGEQGFNNNADNYWDGWEPIRLYLKEQRDLIGWNNAAVAEMFGFHPRMASHWFDESQWSFIREEQYKQLQQAARGDAFKRDYDDLKRDYDDLKRDFYATRAYFDNAHDNMTDVWGFGRVAGNDRYDHATPKPVDMIARVIKSSAPEGGIVYVPFAGTLPEVIACEQLGRKCRAAEISEGYTAVALQRFFDSTQKLPVLVE